jgi:hypothetical protein
MLVLKLLSHANTYSAQKVTTGVSTDSRTSKETNAASSNDKTVHSSWTQQAATQHAVAKLGSKDKVNVHIYSTHKSKVSTIMYSCSKLCWA